MTGRANAYRSLTGHAAEELEKVVVGANLHLGPTQSTTDCKVRRPILMKKFRGLTEEDMTLALAVACAGAAARSGGRSRPQDADVSHRSNECNYSRARSQTFR